VLRARLQHGCPRGARADGRGPARRVDGNGRHRLGVDEQAAVHAGDGPVAGGPDRDGQAVIGREAHRRRYVVLGRRGDRHIGGGDSGQVESRARRVEARGTWLVDSTGKYAVKGGEAGHGSPFDVGTAWTAGRADHRPGRRGGILRWLCLLRSRQVARRRSPPTATRSAGTIRAGSTPTCISSRASMTSRWPAMASRHRQAHGRIMKPAPAEAWAGGGAVAGQLAVRCR
jgi:hypothetical protein